MIRLGLIILIKSNQCLYLQIIKTKQKTTKKTNKQTNNKQTVEKLKGTYLILDFVIRLYYISHKITVSRAIHWFSSLKD